MSNRSASTKALGPVPVGWVGLHCDDPPLSLLVRLGEGPVSIKAGLGGWTVTPRPRQVGMTTWEGVEPFAVDVPLMFDGWADDVSQESSIADLVTVARGDAGSEPGVVEVSGLNLPADRWVIEALEFADTLVRPSDNERLRQVATLTLREYVPPSYLRLRRSALQGAKGKTKVIRAHKGDTPVTIARRYATTFSVLRQMQPAVIVKSTQKLATGAKVRVPVKQDKRAKR
jgi:hypothetical protein